MFLIKNNFVTLLEMVSYKSLRLWRTCCNTWGYNRIIFYSKLHFKVFSKMNIKYQPLSSAHRAYYEKMSKEYKSENERVFFEVMKERQQYVFTFANDLLLSEYDNEDGLYIVRHYFNEFEIGKASLKEEAYAMDLEEAMAVNLKDSGILTNDVTLLGWLRARDYKGIRYNGNFDEL